MKGEVSEETRPKQETELFRAKGGLLGKKQGIFASALLLETYLKRYLQHDSEALWKNKALQKYLEDISREHTRIGHMLHQTTLEESHRAAIGLRYAELSPLVAVFKEIQVAEREALELKSMCSNLDNINERQLLDLAADELQSINDMIEILYGKLIQILVPQDKYDDNDAILEVTAGRTTGGDICQQFTKEVFEMYENYANYKSWVFEVLNYTTAEIGGLHHASACISGEGVYKFLKYEAGTHRVQRIPEVGLSSRMQRIHTGTMTVIVLPRPDEVDIKVDKKDLRIDTFRAKGAGGQHVNTTDSAVRIVHLPSGITVECQQERSQLLNKEKALRMLKAKLYSQTVQKGHGERQSARKLQLGSRAQSDRIRTYNFTQDRLTDHRISYEVRNIKEFLRGERILDDLIRRLLHFAEQETLLEHMENTITSGKKDS
ncbi:hypothetical protein NDU88_003098 [Pleurodeles waltl]|uniref:Prokaryotic-type class I peptide chain release factors domain-containing protein n=1 Tax=Pleurodeles waltl TaxID=8319 RepID=A0AAV7NNR8_PLEWA|nr:hypothetical protein NDU88_003098 [Pleurodeles waltl]